jgi:hypothetical protein
MEVKLRYLSSILERKPVPSKGEEKTTRGMGRSSDPEERTLNFPLTQTHSLQNLNKAGLRT